jgi:hypothetical protein
MEIGIRGPSTALALRLRFGRDDKIWGGDSMERHAKRRERPEGLTVGYRLRQILDEARKRSA